MRSAFIFRVRLVLIGFVVLAFFLGIRLYVVQVVNGDLFSEEAEDQYITVTTALEDRGDIFFTAHDGRETHAATMDSGYRIVVEAGAVPDPGAAYERIGAVTDVIPREVFLSAATSDDGRHRDVANYVEEEDALRVQDLQIEGVAIGRERWRIYPAGELAAQVLGFVGSDGEKKSGRYGLERYWEDTLARNDSSLYVNFFAEIFSNIQTLVSANEDSSSEGDIVTNIEPTVQQYFEDVLGSAREKYNGKEIGGVVMDPQTGKIIAMAAHPTFDPNHFSNVANPTIFANPIVENVYEFGSIFKPLTMASGVDTGAVRPETTYYDEGYVIKSGFRISNYDGVGRGRVDMQEVLNQSLNTGASFVVDKMGGKIFAQYMHDFGIGKKSGIDLPNEVSGLASSLDSGVAVDYASASFGQGIAITPIGMTRALATLANGGKVVTPQVASEIRYRYGTNRLLSPAESVQVLKPETAETITRMLVSVVDDALLEGGVKLDHYSIAAKTGTAQIAIPDGDGYWEDKFLHSFFGYFPAYDARFIIFLYIVEPKGVHYASQTLTYPFMDIAQFLINYYDIPPDR